MNIQISSIFIQVISGLIVSSGPLLMKIGAFLIGIEFLKQFVLKNIILMIGKNYDSNVAKRFYYNVYIEPYARENLRKKRENYKFDSWKNGTDIFDKKEYSYDLEGNKVSSEESEKDWSEDFDFFEDYLDSKENKKEKDNSY